MRNGAAVWLGALTGRGMPGSGIAVTRRPQHVNCVVASTDFRSSSEGAPVHLTRPRAIQRFWSLLRAA